MLSGKTPAANFVVTMTTVQKHRSMCTTVNGRIILCPMTSQAGDIVCVLNSSDTPHMLRPVKEHSKPRYQLIGQAYVYGMMNSEVEGLGLDERDFVLV